MLFYPFDSKPRTYLVPERERTDPPPVSPWGMVLTLLRFKDREIIKKCGLDAYFFLRYLQTLVIIFLPMAFIVIPILVPINYVGGIGQSVVDRNPNSTAEETVNTIVVNVTGLDTLAWGNVRPTNTHRYWAHLIMALLVIVWVCGVFFFELRVYIKVRQDYLTSAEHRLRASATTVLVSSIPRKWLSETALRGLFDVFPGGLRNIWLNRDLTKLLEKIHRRNEIHLQLEAAETELVKACKRSQLKKREADEKKARKLGHMKGPTRKERAMQDKQRDEDARIMAEAGVGTSAGSHDEVPHTIESAVQESREEQAEQAYHDDQLDQEGANEPGRKKGWFKVPVLGTGLAKVNQGITGGAALVGKGALDIGRGVKGELETTNGFSRIAQASDSAPPSRGSERRKVQIESSEWSPRPDTAESGTSMRKTHSRDPSGASQVSSVKQAKPSMEGGAFHNTVRRVRNIEDMYDNEEVKWWQFWKPPPGGYASPVPQGAEDEEFPFDKTKGEKKTAWQTFKSKLPFIGDEEVEEEIEYPLAYNPDYKEEVEGMKAEWEKWIKKSDRPTHRLPLFSWTPSWLPGLPFINKKVDTIYWCREELAKLNLEIEMDKKHPERYPLMNSAFIQFNHQVAAHMACQSVTHHVPKQMTPRVVEVSPNDVIWDNMAVKWWQEWLLSAVAIAVVLGMVLLWAFPVAWTASIAQIDTLIARYQWLRFLSANDTIYSIVKAIAGVLPTVVLAIILILVPIILNWLAGFSGAKTGSQKSERVQVWYFMFLFVQVFLVVTLASTVLNATAILDLAANVASIPHTLAMQLPKGSNYFFSYMILQALSVSSGTLLQVGTLFVWYVLARIVDSTARNKWKRNTTLNDVKWGSFFPVYTNFACIALVYCVIAPIISIFAIITFSLLWIANRYNMLYVTRFNSDTGGVLYPRAINQTFTGVYVMELCLIGLFFLVEDETGRQACVPQAIIMIVCLFLTALYQIMLNLSFAPLFRYLPITFEDEAVLRDEAFQRAQDRRLGHLEDEEDEYDADVKMTTAGGAPRSDNEDAVELQTMRNQNGRRSNTTKMGRLNPVMGIVKAGSWAAREGKNISKRTVGLAGVDLKTAAEWRREKRRKDLEAQRAIGEALYGGYHDEIEDLTPDERDMLVKHAFQHYAMRSRRPTVWIPRDDIGVSDDEIRRTRDFSDHIWISNEGTALDSKVRVVYGRPPPDFSEVDLINL